MMEFFAAIGVMAVFCELLVLEQWRKDRSGAARMALHLWGALGFIMVGLVLYIFIGLALHDVADFAFEHPLWMIIIGVTGLLAIIFASVVFDQLRKGRRLRRPRTDGIEGCQ